jgi:hypothetical protein
MKTVKLFSPILINFSKTRKLIKNGENNFTTVIVTDLVDFRDFRPKVRQKSDKKSDSDFFALVCLT